MRAIRSMRVVAGVAAALACSVAVAPVFAHHSFGLFDMSKSSEIDGTVIKLEWSNPHCWLFVMVQAPDNPEVSYGFEMTSVGEMIRRGWTKTALKPGDNVKVKFHPVRDGRPAGYMMTVMTADGRFIGRPPDSQNGQGAPPPPGDSAPNGQQPPGDSAPNGR
jgi:Family of unknown function (DUF6152)